MEKWSVKMADCVVFGRPALDYNRWNYGNGVVMLALLDIWKKTKDRKYFDVCKDYMEKYIYENGMIRDYRPYEYNIDYINNGKILFDLFEETGDEKYRRAIFKLRNQLYKHPRTSENAFWHKKIYKNQVWLDGLYMEAPFYAQFVKTFDNKKNYNEDVSQLLLCKKNMRGEKTGLYYHAWDESHSEFWCDKKTGLSRNFWGRAMGWFVMALADVLEIIPDDYKDYSELAHMLSEALEALVNFQDTSGCWYQVIDKGYKTGNYIEASCSCMILYALAKAVRLGIIEKEKYNESIEKAFNGIIDEFILITDNSFINLNKNCAVAGLGNKDKRDGSFAYYISEPIICNDLKGVGAFIMAAYEYEIYKNLW